MKRILTFLSLLTVSVGFAQQDPQFSQNMFNRLSINPAYAGSNGAYCGTLMYRDQWDKFPGAPKTVMFSADAQVLPIHGGVGINVLSDQLGNEKTLIANLSYAYRMNLGIGFLSLGLQAGILQKSFIDKFNPLQPGDVAIPNPGVSALVPDFTFGAFYNTSKLYFGISSTHLAAPSLSYGDANIKLDLARHYYVMAGYDYELKPEFTLKPSMLIKSDANQVQLDLNLNLLWNNFVWGGVSYRLQDAVVAMVGVEWNSIKFGYAFDVTTSNLKDYSQGTHEIMLGYCYKPAKTTNFKMHKNVRFL